MRTLYHMLVMVCVLVLATGSAFGQKNLTWQSTSSTAWETAANWYDEGLGGTSSTAPTSADNVLINNTRGASVNPTVSVAGQACKNLVVGNGFILAIGGTGTATILTVGDGLTGNNDVVIQNGGQINNSSGLSSGNPWTLMNTSNDKFRIDNGGRYIHNTPRSFGTPFPAGQCDFDVSSTVEFGASSASAISAQGRTFGNLQLSASGAKTYTAGFSSNVLIINGTLALGTNANFTLTLTGTSSCAINNISIATGTTLSWATSVAPLTITGNIANNGTFTNSSSVENIFFNGNTVITGNAVVFTNGFTVNAGKTLAISQNTNLLAASKTATVNGTFQLNQGSWPGSNGTFVYGAAGTLVFNNSSGSYGPIDDTHLYWPSSSGPYNVNVLGSGGIGLNVGRTVAGLFQTSAGVSGAGNLTLNGTAQINAGGYFTGSPQYGASATLIYNTGGTYGRGSEWNSTDPANVQISNSTALNYPAGGLSARTITGSLTIDAGSALYMDYGNPVPGVGTLSAYSDVVINGSLSLGNQPGGDIHIQSPKQGD